MSDDLDAPGSAGLSRRADPGFDPVDPTFALAPALNNATDAITLDDELPSARWLVATGRGKRVLRHRVD